ncbi:MFS transporter [Gordonia metallireducens]|uniref:MFS transporter n=1 Tax=Gordonia metallireducens TaxID=2897779 RepID=UPI001E4A2A0A|nr:MFS transporter [Gordonia metallireducens]
MTADIAATRTTTGSQAINLALATWAFTISFWAWNLIGPLGVVYTDQLDLSASQKSVLVAIPVLVGSLGRILTGALTDRFGGRLMFTVLLVVTIPFVLLVALAGRLASYPLLLVAGFLLGVAGTTFAVGIPFVNAWYDKSRRGFATGVFGAGMGGTALSAFFTPRFVSWFGYVATHVIIAVALAATAVVCWMFLRDSPRWVPSHDSVVPKLIGAAKLPVTWQLGFLYAATFGGFVAFSTYLPTYLKDVYDFDLQAAGTRTAGFAIAAVLARPLGGILSDRFGPRIITVISCAGAVVLAVWMMTTPPLEIPAGIDFVLMAICMGLGSGSVFSWVAQAAPAERVGSVTGIVGAAGGVGGFFPPLVMGATYDAAAHSYTTGLALLAVFAAGAMVFTIFGIRGRPAD